MKLSKKLILSIAGTVFIVGMFAVFVPAQAGVLRAIGQFFGASPIPIAGAEPCGDQVSDKLCQMLRDGTVIEGCPTSEGYTGECGSIYNVTQAFVFGKCTKRSCSSSSSQSTSTASAGHFCILGTCIAGWGTRDRSTTPGGRMCINRDCVAYDSLGPVDGQWSDWSPSTCPVSCGGGKQTRTCIREGKNGGKTCSQIDGGNNEQWCNSNPCPNRDGDSTPDKDDTCPDDYGTGWGGCPVPTVKGAVFPGGGSRPSGFNISLVDRVHCSDEANGRFVGFNAYNYNKFKVYFTDNNGLVTDEIDGGTIDKQCSGDVCNKTEATSTFNGDYYFGVGRFHVSAPRRVKAVVTSKSGQTNEIEGVCDIADKYSNWDTWSYSDAKFYGGETCHNDYVNAYWCSNNQTITCRDTQGYWCYNDARGCAWYVNVREIQCYNHNP